MNEQGQDYGGRGGAGTADQTRPRRDHRAVRQTHRILAMQTERERFLGASLYERTPGRQDYAHGYKP